MLKTGAAAIPSQLLRSRTERARPSLSGHQTPAVARCKNLMKARCPGSPPDAFACLPSKALHQLDAIAERVGDVAAAITGQRLAFLEADALFP